MQRGIIGALPLGSHGNRSGGVMELRRQLMAPQASCKLIGWYMNFKLAIEVKSDDPRLPYESIHQIKDIVGGEFAAGILGKVERLRWWPPYRAGAVASHSSSQQNTRDNSLTPQFFSRSGSHVGLLLGGQDLLVCPVD